LANASLRLEISDLNPLIPSRGRNRKHQGQKGPNAGRENGGKTGEKAEEKKEKHGNPLD